MKQQFKYSLVSLMFCALSIPTWGTTVSFSALPEGVTGKMPSAITCDEGGKITLPLNRQLYKEGATLTAWTDGTNQYVPGSEYAPAADVTLSPVFSANAVALSDRTESVTLKWDFQTQNGAPTLAYQGGGATGVYVTQATVNGSTIDVKLDFDATSGKIANANWKDWCQMNSGTKFTIPSCKGAVVSIEAYSAPTTTTIDGLTDYTANGNVISMEVGNKAETIDIVIGNGSYYRYIQTVLPVVVPDAAGKTYTNETASVKWAFNSSSDYDTAVKAPEDAFTMIAFNLGNATISGTGTSSNVSDVTFVKIKPATGASDVISWNIKAAAGLTFTPTRVRGYINRGATDAENGVIISLKAGDDAAVALGTYTAQRYNRTTDDKYASNKNLANQFDITLTAEQQESLKTSDMLSLISTIGVASGKEGFFSGIEIYGVVNGTIAAVNKYTVAIAAAPAEGGSVSIYPKADEYVEGDEITLSATENFGYDFVNWTNAAGEVASTEAKFKTTVSANETYTANFKQVETYALTVAIDGGANAYMLSYTPAPTMVDEKMMYEAGTKVTVAASENPILTFNNWSTGETNKELVVTMDKNVEVTANYSAIDFIVGWDFYQTGGRTRVADFVGNTENEAATMDMIKADGTSVGFYLRPYNNSYEGKTCALNWNALADKLYFQTCINTADFSNIKVQSQMLYNYNAYTVQKLEASLDGETWETITSQDLGGTKNWQAVNGTLPANYDHQTKVYLRWIPDYTSAIKGTTSNNDGTCLTNVYVIADKALVNDGKAPVLVASVPAEGATNASANGKIVLTFDEKVKVAEGAKATLAEMSLVPVVSGKTISFEYKALEYSTAYTFKLPANSVSDLTDNYYAQDIVVNFQTKVKPSVEKGSFDAIVSNGEELAAAIKAANSRKDQTKRYRIFVKKGAHVLPVNGEKTTGGDGATYDDPRTYMTGSNISIIGEDYETTSFTNITPAANWDNGYGAACPLEGIGKGDVLINSGTSNYFQGVTIRTSMGDAHGRDIAFQDKGNKTIFKNARLWGYQDTYVSNSNKSRYYFENGVIRGRTDYICGKGDVWYEQVTFQQVKAGYLAVPSQPTQYGYILNKCTIKSDGTGDNSANGSFTLGRPWGSGTPIALYLNCVFEAVPSAEGWNEMSGGYPARFAEYNSVTANGTVIDLSKRKKTFGDHTNCNNPVLTAAEASEYSIAKVMGNGDDWDPTALTEQASAPQGVVLNGKVLTWDNSNYVLCWAVCKNGTVVDFTIEPTYTVDDAEATWSVRAANEMGGLGEATQASVSTAIGSLEAVSTDACVYDLCGRRVNQMQSGMIYFQNGKRIVIK